MGLTAVILCGGAGARLWPVSREQFPKPFIKMSDNESLLQKTLKRACALPEVDSLLVVSGSELFSQVLDEFKDPPPFPCQAILEPFGRNTAAAVAAAALEVARVHGEEQLMLVMPADHLIGDQRQFEQAVQAARAIARSGQIVVFGIKPEYPETGYGYIEAHGNRVARFVEKPNREQACQYMRAGNFLWNSGMFCFSCASVLEQFAVHCPQVLHAVNKCVANSQRQHGQKLPALLLDSELFAQVPDISIDYAIMEKSAGLAVVEAGFTWSDIGSWESLDRLGARDEHGNNLQAQAIIHNVANCYIKSESRLVGALGLNNLLIIDTPDALLVADKSAAQDVKHIYNELKKNNHPTYRHHCRVARSWGAYTVLEEGSGYKIKRIEVNPGASLSLQMHYHRSEHWVVVAGQALVRNGDDTITLNANESAFIPAGHKHRLHNPTSGPLIIIEVQSGSYLGEDDIVRFAEHS